MNLPQLKLSRPGCMFPRLADRHVGDRFHDPFEIRLAHARCFGVRRRIAKIDRHRHAVANRELDRVQIVTEILIQRQHAFLDFFQDLARRLPLGLVTQMIGMPRFVRHDAHVPLIDRVAAEVHVELHFLLQHHDELAGLAVGPEKFLGIVQLINVFPSAAGERFEERRPADVG